MDQVAWRFFLARQQPVVSSEVENARRLAFFVDRDAVFAAETPYRVDDFAPPRGVEHRRRLVEHYAAGPHRDDARYGNALLLPA